LPAHIKIIDNIEELNKIEEKRNFQAIEKLKKNQAIIDELQMALEQELEDEDPGNFKNPIPEIQNNNKNNNINNLKEKEQEEKKQDS
jgi:hypothetical protein